MASEWEAAAAMGGMDLGMGIRHNSAMPPQQPLSHFYGGGGPLDFFPMPGGGATSSSSTPSSGSSCFNLSFAAADHEFSIPVPREEAAELEWLSNFVDDSYPDMPPSYPPEVQAAIAAAAAQQQQQRPNNCSVLATGARTKRSRPSLQNRPAADKAEIKAAASSDSNNDSNGGVRRCTHCASEKTPQWRTGPLGPKTLCNACGVRYKSGRLVPEYRPAASPTFVLTQHSNSHRKVMELRRQKDIRATTPSSAASSFRDYATLC
ncbi:hypothetical protein EJB05_08343 [Eragrostis curvula]|uniref:GATA-type domain-containing protein n=1 Tax=Eragrostis curvula TaxID=38414 RepID=A0A5J9WKC4_9POAL|nr:hypothetical protein EJB05_08343 [Eragrostis curvula]